MTAAGRQPFRFRLRTLLLLMLVIGVALGWRVERARRQRKAVQFVQQVRGTYAYDFEYDEAGQRLVDTKPHGPIWLNDRLGVDFFNTVVQVSLSDEPVRDISPLANLPGMRWLSLEGTQVDDLTPLAGMRQLEALRLGAAPVSDLSPLSSLTNLKTLSLYETRVEDLSPLAGLARLEGLELQSAPVKDVTPLAQLRELKMLELHGAPVRDIEPLLGLPSLTYVGVYNTKVPLAAVRRLREASPNCAVITHLPSSDN